MNAARAIELAFAEVMRAKAELGAGCVVRAWQSLASDPEWMKLAAEKKDRAFPLVDIRCGSPRFDANQRTSFCEAQILCATKTDDDAGHDKIQSLYGEVQRVCDLLYAQYVAGTDGEELAAFKARLTDELGATFHFGGFTWGEGMSPSDVDGANMIGIAMQTHFSRRDI